jgi:hypothetical protein
LRTTEQYLQLKRDIEDKYDPAKKQAHKAAKQLLSDNPEAGNNKERPFQTVFH